MRLPKGYSNAHPLSVTQKLVEQDHHKWYGSLGKPTGKRRQRQAIATCDRCGAQPEFLHAEGSERLCDGCL